MFDITSFIQRAIVQSIALLYGCTGETITEKSGNLNLGLPGVMYIGAISAVPAPSLPRTLIPLGGAPTGRR